MVVVAEELSEQCQQMALVQDDDMVETLLAKGPNYGSATEFASGAR